MAHCELWGFPYAAKEVAKRKKDSYVNPSNYRASTLHPNLFGIGISGAVSTPEDPPEYFIITEYSYSKKEWYTIVDLRFPLYRRMHAVAFHDDYFYVFGGKEEVYFNIHKVSSM